MLEQTTHASRYEIAKKSILLLNLMFFQMIILIGLTQANSGAVIDYTLDSPAKEIGTDLIVTADSASTFYSGLMWGAVGVSGTRGYYGLQSEGGTPYERHLHLTIWDAPDGSQTKVVNVGDGVEWKQDCSEGCAIICTYKTNWMPNHLYKLIINVTNTDVSTLYKAYFYNYTSSELKYIATIEYPKKGILIQAIASFLEDYGYHQNCTDASYRSVMYGNGYKILSDGLKAKLCEARYSPSGSDCPERNGVAYGNYFKIESGAGATEQTPPGSILGIICDNLDPTSPSIPSGPASGVLDTFYSYSTSATDPGADQVKYIFDWGDATTSTTGLVNSGTTASASHSWSTAGTYPVRAMAIDSKGASSGWSGSLNVVVNEPDQHDWIEWVRTYGLADDLESGEWVDPTIDGGYIVVAKAEDANNYDQILLIKTDPMGFKIWENNFGGLNDDDVPHEVHQTSDGGYIIVGGTYSKGAGAMDVWLIKTDSLGNRMWDSTFGDTGWDEGFSVWQTTDGNYIVTGVKQKPNSGDDDLWLIKVGSNGAKIWDRLYGLNRYESGRSVRQTTDGGYIIAGYTDSYSVGLDDDIWLIKTLADGSIQWERKFGGDNEDQGYSIQTVSDGYVVAGMTRSFGEGAEDVWILKTDLLGNKLWDRTYGGSGEDEGYCIRRTSDDGYIVSGRTHSDLSNFDLYLIKIGPQGELQWEQTFDKSSRWDEGKSVLQSSDGSIICCGYTHPSAGIQDIWLLKVKRPVNTKTYWDFDTDFEEWTRIGIAPPWADYSIREAVNWYDQWAGYQGVVVMDACKWPEYSIQTSTGISNLVRLPASASDITINCTKDSADGGISASLIDSDGNEHQLGDKVLIGGDKTTLRYGISNWAGQTVMLVIRAYGACSSGGCDPGSCCCAYEYVGVNSVRIESNGKDEIGVFRNGPWYLDYNGNQVWDPASGDVSFWFGTSGDLPVSGDWNGDGKDEIGVFRNGPWYLDYNGNQVWDPASGDVSFWFGTSGDLPVSGDWNGDGKDEIGVFRNGPWYLDYNGNRAWDPASGDVSFWFGTSGDLPLAGDWNGDGKDEIGVFRNGPWYLDNNGNQVWDPASGDVSFWFGTSGDLSLAGDWNGDGKDKIGVFRNGPWYLDYNGNRVWDPASGDVSFWFGTSGDLPLKGYWS